MIRLQVPVPSLDRHDLHLALGQQVPVKEVKTRLDKLLIGKMTFQQIIDKVVQHVVGQAGSTLVLLQLQGDEVAYKVEKFDVTVLRGPAVERGV